MHKYVGEFIGTFFLFLTIGLTAVLGTAGPLAPLAIGGVLAALTHALRPLSGAHFNPALTVAIAIRGRCPRAEIAPRLAVQFLAAALSSFLVLRILSLGALDPGQAIKSFAFQRTGAAGAAVAAELLFTFALAFVFLTFLTSRATEANPALGPAVGATVMAATFAAGSVSLAALNPAVTLGLCLTGRLAWADSWIHLLPQFLGAILAAFTFKALHPDDL